MDDRENIDRHIFAWFNERYPDEMARCIAAWDNSQPDQAWLDARDAEFDDRWNARMNP